MAQDIKETCDILHPEHTIKEKPGKKIPEKHYWVDTYKNAYTLIKRFLIAAAIVFIILIPVVYLYNTFLYPHRLVITKTLHNVTIKRDQMSLFLAPGSHLKEGYELITGEKSACTVQYAQKSTIALQEKAEMNITGLRKSRVLLTLAAGKIHIKENKKKGTAIHFCTPLAYIYATGTEYSIHHSVNNNETIVAVSEGFVHIETIPRKEEILLKAGEEVIIREDAAPVKKEIKPHKEQDWHISTVYTHSSAKTPVSGFDRHGEIIVAGTGHSLVCFAGDKILWEYIMETANFISKPAIDNNNVYIPAAKAISGFDLSTGKKEPDIELRDTLRPGHTILHYKNNLYIVFVSGIYVFNRKTCSISAEPFIPVIDATLPVFYADMLYVTSYIAGSLDAYTLSGEKVWSLQLNDKSNCSPVVVDNGIVTGTKSGTLYKITLNGTIEKNIQLEENIISIVYGNSRVFFVMTSKGKFYEINTHLFTIEKVYYNVYTGIVYNNTIIMGMTDGTIKIIDIKTKREWEITLPYSAASAFAGYKDLIYAGLKNGDILKLEKK